MPITYVLVTDLINCELLVKNFANVFLKDFLSFSDLLCNSMINLYFQIVILFIYTILDEDKIFAFSNHFGIKTQKFAIIHKFA